MTTSQALDGARLVQFVFDRFSEGDIPAAIARWHEDARWHPVTHSGVEALDRPRSRDEYFGEVLPLAFSMLEGYTFEIAAIEAFGPLVVAHVRSSWTEGEDARAGEGIMVFRVADGLVADLYVMNAAGAGIF